MKYKRLGEMLVDVKLITEEQLAEALQLQKGSGKRLGTVLIDNGFITEAQLIEMLRVQLGIDFIDLTKVTIDPEMVNVLPKNIAQKQGIIPVRMEKDLLYLAMEDPLNFMAVEAARVATRKKIIPKELQQTVVARIKVMGHMDIAERRIPQDGRTAMRIKGEEIDLRLSTLPTIFGEKIVIRLLLKNQEMLTREGIGLTQTKENTEKFERLLTNNSGVILIVGPTGSGKSSTMYTMIRELKSESVNLIMIEDPVEYQMEGVTQVQINEKTGMTFANALRAILRQDPDIIGVGEIRDGETAEIAMRAAMTGHLVISTIHTEDAISAIDRLRDMGVEPYLIAGGVRGIISQRLVRKICGSCRSPQMVSDQQRDLVGLSKNDTRIFYKGKGCHMCFDSGYYGRIGVFEILTLNQKIRDCITDERPKGELRQAIADSGFIPMMRSGLQLASSGITSIEELCRTISIVD